MFDDSEFCQFAVAPTTFRFYTLFLSILRHNLSSQVRKCLVPRVTLTTADETLTSWTIFSSTSLLGSSDNAVKESMRIGSKRNLDPIAQSRGVHEAL